MTPSHVLLNIHNRFTSQGKKPVIPCLHWDCTARLVLWLRKVLFFFAVQLNRFVVNCLLKRLCWKNHMIIILFLLSFMSSIFKINVNSNLKEFLHSYFFVWLTEKWWCFQYQMYEKVLNSVKSKFHCINVVVKSITQINYYLISTECCWKFVLISSTLRMERACIY